MPYRRTRRVRRRPSSNRVRRRIAPRATRRSRVIRRRTSAISRGRRQWSNPLPQTTFLRLRYIDNGFDGGCDVASNYRSFHCFYANSIYDPDVSGVGVQPYAYDAYVALFNGGSYRVVGSSITVNFSVNSPTATAVMCYVYPYRSSTAPTYSDISDLRNVPMVRSRLTDGVSGHTRKNWVKSYCSTRRLFTDRTASDQSFTAAMGANPATGWFWHVIFDTSTAAGADVDIIYDVKIVYYVVLSRVQIVNES